MRMEFLTYNGVITEIVFACYVAPNTGDAVHKNRGAHGIALHTGGKRKYIFSDSTELYVQKNDLIFLPEQSSYTVETIEPGACYAINFKIDNTALFSPFVIPIKNTAVLEHFRISERVYTAKKAGYEWKCMAELYAVLYDLKREREKAYFTKKEEALLFPAVEYIHDHFTKEKISVEFLSSLCGISSVYFRRLFVRQFGVSPVKYINALRLSHAKDLIRSEMYSVEQAARLSGFSDESYFCRLFKKEAGVTPSEYRN